MKRNLFVVFSLLLTLSSFAQFNGDGYYRVKNVGSGRYITVKDNRGSVNPATTSADMGAVELYKGFENVVSDPSSILYIDQTSSGYKFHAQGTDTYEIIGYYLNLSKNSDGSYKAYQGNSMMVMYLGDRVTSSALKGSLSTNAKGTNRDWYILPFNASGNDNYFGLTPEVKAGNDYYASFYASFPFTALSKNLKVYYIDKVDKGMAVYKEVTDGKVPAATPVFVKCASDKPADNRLDIVANNATISGNKLGGVYFNNSSSAHYNRTAYDANTMRVLGTADGKLAYVKADYDFLPANKSYLNVPAGSPDVIKLVTEAEYQKIIDEEYSTFTITFKIGNEVISSQKLKVGSAIKAPTAPSKEGYTFNGWGDVPATMPAKDLTIVGSYTVNNYTLTFKIDEEVISEQSVAYGSAIKAPTAPAKEGYTFGGWEDVPATMPAEDLVIEGSYSVNYYTLTFKIGDEVYATESVAYGSTIKAPAAPAKEGYTFNGWEDVPATMPAKNLTFDGSYTINYYTLTFVLDDEVIYTESLAYGTAIEVPEVSEKEGYTFSGWGDVPATMPAKDLTIVGLYIEKDYYTVTFKVDDEIISMQSLTEGDSIYVPDAPEKEGHTFDGWGDVPATMPAQNLTFVAIYTAKMYTITFEIGTQVIAKMTLPYGTPIEAPEAPEKEGHTFSGWDDVPATMPAFNWSCRGYYRVNSYTIQYKVDGKNYQKKTVQYGAAISLIAEPKKEGRTFSGWSELPETMPANNVEVVGSFMYYVYYYAEDVLVHTEKLYYGTEIPEYVYQPTDEVDTFLGWLGDTYETMPAHDITYIANIEQSVEVITTDDLVDIYTITGAKIMTRVSLDEAKAVLRRGIYIVNGKKMIIE